jgi:alpha-L-fucosidase
MAQYSIPAKMNWWYESRFGMFIHFGSYSYLAQGEWAMSGGTSKTDWQTKVSAKFNPTNFDAGAIARLAQKAGMKYLVITAKHHEGFSMWDTHVESFKDVTGTKDYDLPGFTAFRTRDILKELKDSCEAVGVKFCLYYSILDWNHSSQTGYNFTKMNSFEERTAYITDMKAQLKELIDKYKPAVFWFDGDWTYNSGKPTLASWWTKADGIDLYNYLTGLDSTLLINERVFRGAGLGDWECPEQTVPAAPESRPWETCQTMNGSWGYASWDNNYKSTKTLIQQLARVVSRDGNYLLNIGPKGDGTVPNESVTKLDSIGDWMDIYGKSIYGSTRSPFSSEPAWGLYTKKDGKLYAHVFSWPANGLLKVPSLTNTINKIYLLNDTTNLLSFTDSSDTIRISMPVNAPNPINSIVVIDVAGVPNASQQWIAIPGKIEAEQFSKQYGIQTENTGDTGGGLNIGWIDANDWMEYAISVESDTVYTATFRCASPGSGGAVSILLDGASVGSISFTGTGAWQTYKSFSKDITLKAGKHTLKLLVTTSGFNFNWFMFEKKSVTGINDINEGSLRVFPNPSNGELNITSNSFQFNSIEIIACTGEKVYSRSVVPANLISFNPYLQKGIYILKLSNNTQTQNIKIIVD